MSETRSEFSSEEPSASTAALPPDPSDRMAVGPTYRTDVVAPHAFYRTKILEGSAALTCRATQISQAVYDRGRNRTYIAYTAGRDHFDGDCRPYTSENPYIAAFDHGTQTWQGPYRVGDVHWSESRGDCHDYPQILIDSQGYLHVFHTFHFSGRNIVHFKSKAPHDIQPNWVRTEIPQTSGNTYGAAFKNNQGDFYVFYRDTVWRRRGDTQGQTGLWYEPQRYVKSTDEGRTWSLPRLLIDPGRPSASDADPLAPTVTSLINDSGWNTIYVANWLQDAARNRLIVDFTATFEHADQWGNRIIFVFDMNDDKVLTMKGTCLGSRIDRPAYLGNESEGIRIYTARIVRGHATTYGRGLGSQAIVIEGDPNGYPTVYYTKFESNKPEAGPDSAEFYKSGWDRFRRARWTGDRWDDDYVGKVADPAFDPFIQQDDLTKRRRETGHVYGAEYRGAEGTFLYVKTKWGGKPFWLNADGSRNPLYVWNASLDYQNPSRVFNANWGWTRNVRMFNDQHLLELRGIANFTLVPGGHEQIRAVIRMPRYTTLTPEGGATGQTNQYAIGEDLVWGEDALQPLRPDIALPAEERRPGDATAQH